MIRSIPSNNKRQEGRVCDHCKRKYPTWCFLANPVMPNSIDPLCYRCRVTVENARSAKPRGAKIDRERVRRTRNQFAGAMRDAILERDGHACCICGEKRHLEVHHIVAISAGGTNDKGNLLTLCIDHHKAAHRKEISVAELQSYAAHEWQDRDVRGLTPDHDANGLRFRGSRRKAVKIL